MAEQLRASVIIPTYNRQAVLAKTLTALYSQTVPAELYEIVIVDDGSTDGTADMVASFRSRRGPRLIYHWQENKGRSAARNKAVCLASNELLIFVDSDLIPCSRFVAAHLRAHQGQPKLIGHGPVIHCNSLEHPEETPFKVTDISRAFFATGNASVRREHILTAGGFDEDFVEYGWEDLELGQRLRAIGLRATSIPEARGYHYKKPFSLDQLPAAVEREVQRGHTALLYYAKHPTWRVRLSTMYSPVTFFLDRLLNPWRWLDSPRLLPTLQRLQKGGLRTMVRLVTGLVLFHAYVRGMREAAAGGRHA